MRARTRTTWALILLGGLILAGIARAAAPTITLERWVIGGGGGRSVDGTTVLQGTIGQPVVGRVSSAAYELDAGFWASVGAPRRVYVPAVLSAYSP
jgi:hypothetical protein